MIRLDSWGECIMEAAMAVMGPAGRLPLFKNGRYKWPKQSEVAEFFGVPTEHVHRALPDARQAAQVYEAVLRMRG